MGLLTWLQETGPATFIRESPSYFGYPTFLFAHTFGLAIVVGISSVLAARVLGLAPSIPLESFKRLFPVMWAGFLVNLVSGTGLWMADAVNKTIPGDGRQAPIFLAKMFFVILGAVVLWKMEKRMDAGEFSDRGLIEKLRPLAGGLLACWMLGMITGRLIGYASVILR